MEATESGQPSADGPSPADAVGGQSSNTQAWMERYARRIKPNGGKFRSKSMRRIPIEDMPAQSKFGDGVASKVLLLSRWRTKARKQADDRSFSMAARRPWLSHFREVSERSSCVYGAGMEHDGIDPHVEMVLRLEHAQEDQRLEQAAKLHAQEMTPMDVIQQRVRQAMRGVKLWTAGGCRTVGEDDQDRSYRGGRRRSSVYGGGSKDPSVRNGRESMARMDGGGGGGGAAAVGTMAAAAAARRASLLMPVLSPSEAAALQGGDVALGSRPFPSVLEKGLGISRGLQPIEEAAGEGRLGGTEAAAAASAAGGKGQAGQNRMPAGGGLVASAPEPADGPPAVAAADAVSSNSTAAAAPGPGPKAPEPRAGQIWPDRGELSAVLPRGLDPASVGSSTGAGLLLRGAPGGGGVPGPPSPTRGPEAGAAATSALVFAAAAAPHADSDQRSPSSLALGQEASSRQAGLGDYQSIIQQLQQQRRQGIPGESGLESDVRQQTDTLETGPSPDYRPAPNKRTGRIVASSGVLGGLGGNGATLHDIAPSLGGMDACRVAPGTTATAAADPAAAAAAAAATASAAAAAGAHPSLISLSKQVRGGPLPHSLTMTKRGRRPAAAPGGAASSVPPPGAPTPAPPAAAAVGRAGRGRPLGGIGGNSIGGGLAGARATNPLEATLGRRAHFEGASGSSFSSMSGEWEGRPAASLSMVDAALFWSEGSTPHGTVGGGGGGGSGAPSPLPRPHGGAVGGGGGGGGGTLSRLASMVSIRPPEVPLPPATRRGHGVDGETSSPTETSTEAISPTSRRNPDAAAADAAPVSTAAVRREAISLETNSPTGARAGDDDGDSSSGPDVHGGGGGGGGTLSLERSAVSLVAGSLSTGGLPSAAAAAVLRTGRSASGRSLTSWPGTAPTSTPQPFVGSNPIQLPHVEAPPSPARASAPSVPPPNRLQPLHPSPPLQTSNATAGGGFAPLLHAPSAARGTLTGVSGVGVGVGVGPVGQLSPSAVRLSGFASPARMMAAIPADGPAGVKDLLQHMPSSGGLSLASATAPLSPSGTPEGGRPLPPHTSSDPLSARTARLESEDSSLSPAPQPQPPGALSGSRPLLPPPVRAGALSAVAGAASGAPGGGGGAAAGHSPANGLSPNQQHNHHNNNNHPPHHRQHHQASHRRSASFIGPAPYGRSSTDLADVCSTSAPGAGDLDGVSRLASDSAALLGVNFPTGQGAVSPAAAVRLGLAGQPSRRLGSVSGPQPRMLLPELRNSVTSLAGAGVSADSTPTAAEDSSPAVAPATGRLLPEIPSPMAGPAALGVTRGAAAPLPPPAAQYQMSYRGRAL